MIEHHLDDDMLQQYAAGTLAEGWSVAVATHLALCPACRSKLSVLESVGGYFIDSEPADEAEVSQSWESVKAKIDAGQIDKVVHIKKGSSSDHTYPEPLRTYIDAAGGLKWRKLGRGAAQMVIPTGDESEHPPGVHAQVLVREDQAVIPNLDHIESLVAQALGA